MKIPYDKKHRWFIYHVKNFDKTKLRWIHQRVEETGRLLFKCYQFKAFDYDKREYFTLNLCVRNWITGDHEPIWTLERDDIEVVFDKKHINIYEQIFNEQK